jgi:YqaJ-like viral recombinase domain
VRIFAPREAGYGPFRTSRPVLPASATAPWADADRVYLLGFLRSLTPGPPPFASMNSMPPASSAARILRVVSPLPPNSPSADSSRAIVGSETFDRSAKSDCDHPSRARAAFTCRIVINFGEVGPEDLSANLIVQLGVATEDLNRAWYERNTGHAITAVQTRVKHPVLSFMAATLDGMVTETGAVYEAKFMLPWSFSEGAAAEKHMAQLQHNMWVTNAKMAALSIITGGGKWVEITIAADPLYQHLLLTAEKKFWRCVQSGDRPHLFEVVPPKPRIEGVRIVDMAAYNSWADLAALFCSTRTAFL